MRASVLLSLCPARQARVSFIEPRARLGSPFSTIGWWFQEKLQGHQPTIEVAEKIFSADIAAETVQQPIRWKDQTPDGLEAKGQALVRAFLNVHGDLSVVGVEQRFEVDIEDPETGESLPRPLVGYFDLVVRRGRRNCRNQDDLEGMAPAEHPATFASRFVRNGGQRPTWRALARRHSCHSQTTRTSCRRIPGRPRGARQCVVLPRGKVH